MSAYEPIYERTDTNTVTVRVDRYETLVRAAEHYKNIVRAATGGANIPKWSPDPRLDMDAVEEYLQVAEFDLIDKTFKMLITEKELREEEQA